MAEGGGISYRIELDSSDAEQALENLKSSGERLADSFKKIAEAISEGGFGTLTTVLEAAGAAVAGLTVSLFGMAKASSDTVVELGKVADQTGSTVEQMSTLKAALGEFGANTDTLGRAFQRMGNTIQQVWPGIEKSISDSANKIADDQNKLEQANLKAAESYTALERASQNAAQQQINDALGVIGAKQSVKNAEIALAQALGYTVSQQTLQQQKINNAQLALASARQREAEVEAKASRDAADRELKRQQLELAAAAASQALSDARKKAAEDEGNSIDNLKARVDNLAKGISGGTKAAGLSVDNFIKGLLASVGSGVTSLEGMGGSFGEITGQAPELRAVLLKLADAFQNITDRAQKTAIATKLFGRKDAAEMVESLSHGSAALKELEDRAASLGLVISHTDEVIAKKFEESLNRLGNVIGIVATQFGSLFQRSFIDLLDSMAEGLGRNRASVIAWGKAIADTVGPVIESFARALAGTAEAGKDDWAVNLIKGVKDFGTVVSAVFGGVVMPLFRGLGVAVQGLMLVFDGLAAVINMTGTALKGVDVLVGALVARWGFGLASMVLALSPFWLAILGIGLALGLLVTYWSQVKAAAVSAFDFINAKAAAFRESLNTLVGTSIAGAWQWIVDTFNSAVASIGSAIDKSTALITAWVTTPVANAWQWIKDKFNSVAGGLLGGSASSGGSGGLAGGGLLGGRGTGTSDSNLAWVSRGEYITPARAVGQPGVLAFLEALRRSGGNLRDVLDGMGRFALGGLVHAPIAIPAFAGGGMNHVTINFPGLPEITGLRASSGVVDELRKAAAMAQVRSGGRKPSRYS